MAALDTTHSSIFPSSERPWRKSISPPSTSSAIADERSAHSFLPCASAECYSRSNVLAEASMAFAITTLRTPEHAPALLSKGERLASLDVYRGLTIAGMILVTDPGTYSAVYWP